MVRVLVKRRAAYREVRELIAAFRVSALWFLLCLFISPVALVFVILHWDVARNPFLLQLVGFGLIFAGAAGT